MVKRLPLNALFHNYYEMFHINKTFHISRVVELPRVSQCAVTIIFIVVAHQIHLFNCEYEWPY